MQGHLRCHRASTQDSRPGPHQKGGASSSCGWKPIQGDHMGAKR